MCTVVARRWASGWTVWMNRDELRTRSDGEPPSHWSGADILAPRDPDAGGTWIGVRRDGTWACLLNGYQPADQFRAPNTPMTRGRIVPLVLGSDAPIDALSSEDLTETRSFRIWIGSERGIMDAFWDGQTLYRETLPASAWHFVTSSSFEQDRVQRLRSEAFGQWIVQGAPHLDNGLPSVLVDAYGLDPVEAIQMAREHSHTKSCTELHASGAAVTMQYWRAEGMSGEPFAAVRFPPAP